MKTKIWILFVKTLLTFLTAYLFVDLVLAPIFNTAPFERLNSKAAAMIIAVVLPLLSVLTFMHYIVAGGMTTARIQRFAITLFGGAAAVAITLFVWNAVGRVPSLYQVLFTDMGAMMHGLCLSLVVLIMAIISFISTRSSARQQPAAG